MNFRGPWQILSSEVKYQNPWIEVIHHQVLTPAKTKGVYGEVRFANRALGVVALNAKNEICLVGQHRFPLDEYTWEIPEGGGPQSETPLESIQRELKEETGYSATQWKCLAQELHLSNSVTNELCWLYLATGLSEGQANPEDTEELKVRWVPFNEALSMISTGEIKDILTVTALLLSKEFIQP